MIKKRANGTLWLVATLGLIGLAGDTTRAAAADVVWANGGTDYGTASNWTNNLVPGSADFAWFSAEAAAQPVLNASRTNNGIRSLCKGHA